MKKNKKIVIILAFAVILSILSGIFIYSYLSPARETLYIFNADYAAGTQITGEMLTPVQIDSAIYVAGNAEALSEIFVTPDNLSSVLANADTLKVDVSAGTPLMPTMLSIAGGNDIEVAMKPSAIALTVSVSDVTGISGDLTKESHVNVYVTYRTTGTELVLENMRVLAVHTDSGALSSVTLEVDNNQALKLIDASNNGVIYLGLINASGYQYVLGDDPVIEDDVSETGTETGEGTTDTSIADEGTQETSSQDSATATPTSDIVIGVQ